MSVSILNLGCGEEDVFLLREVAAAEDETPLVHTFFDPVQAQVWAGLHRPELIVIDARRFGRDTLPLVTRFAHDPTCEDIPILAVVDEYRRDDRAEVLLAGAAELITAPIDAHECQARVLNLLALGAHHRLRRNYLRQRRALHGPAESIRQEGRDLLLRLARAGQFRDKDMGAHIERIGKISRSIAERLELPASECDIIEIAAPMHDIGKIGIPDAILQKPGPLTAIEREHMEMHTVIGHELLKNSHSAYLQCGAEIALAHHEKYDGSGYPYGIGGEEIPLAARIVAVADVYDALSMRRSYKQDWPPERVRSYLAQQRGKHFDPQCVDALVAQLSQAAGF
jgi:two-component system, response regulator RpfG